MDMLGHVLVSLIQREIHIYSHTLQRCDSFITSFTLYQGVVTPISTIIYRAETCTMPTHVWPTYVSIFYKKVTWSPAVKQCGHTVTGSCWTVTDCYPGHSSKYSAYWSDHFVYVDEKQIIASPKKLITDRFNWCSRLERHCPWQPFTLIPDVHFPTLTA